MVRGNEEIMEDKCVVCGETVPEGRHVCQICNREYDGEPALCRRDNRTGICPECGTREAIREVGIHFGMSAAEIKKEEERAISEIRKISGGIKNG